MIDSQNAGEYKETHTAVDIEATVTTKNNIALEESVAHTGFGVGKGKSISISVKRLMWMPAFQRNDMQMTYQEYQGARRTVGLETGFR